MAVTATLCQRRSPLLSEEDRITKWVRPPRRLSRRRREIPHNHQPLLMAIGGDVYDTRVVDRLSEG